MRRLFPVLEHVGHDDVHGREGPLGPCVREITSCGVVKVSSSRDDCSRVVRGRQRDKGSLGPGFDRLAMSPNRCVHGAHGKRLTIMPNVILMALYRSVPSSQAAIERGTNLKRECPARATGLLLAQRGNDKVGLGPKGRACTHLAVPLSGMLTAGCMVNRVDRVASLSRDGVIVS